MDSNVDRKSIGDNNSIIFSTTHFLILIKLLFLLVLFSCEENNGIATKECSQLDTPTTSITFKGLCYGPHRDNENPNFGIQPTVEELHEDLAFIKNFDAPIRTYGVTDNLEQIPILCEQYEIDNYPGAWLSRYPCENERQIENLIHIANQNLDHVKGLIVGNEVLLRKDISEDELLEFIARVKNETDLPIATAEVWKDWIDHSRLAEAVDILFVHIYPFWDGVAVEEGADYILEKWNELKTKYPNKKMVIGETGWPSEGDPRGLAIPSPENQKRFITDFIAMTEENNIDYFYFEIFDEKWKTGEGSIGTSWGMYESNGQLKEHLADLFPPEAHNVIHRPSRIVSPTEATLPLYVYSDGCSPLNSFYASGWMGELAEIEYNDSTVSNYVDIIDELSMDNPYSGETCIRISYTPSIDKWGGIYWQFPVNNWGAYPGYDFSKFLDQLDEDDVVQLSFWARGKNGGEKAEFKTGGMNNSDFEYRDSFGPDSTGIVTLKKEWEKHTLMITSENLEMVIGGFAWVTNFEQNPHGATIYLDEIVFKVMM